MVGMIPQQKAALWFSWASLIVSEASIDVFLQRTAWICSITASLCVAIPKLLEWWRNRK